MNTVKDISGKVLAVAHRVCPGLAPSAVAFTSKIEMVKATTASLAASLGQFGGKVNLTVILDGCPDWKRLFEDEMSQYVNISINYIVTPSIGNFATYAKQFEILLAEKDADYLYFSEDDYIYQSNAFTAMADMLERACADFVTPLDHPDRYNHALGNRGPIPKEHISVSPYCHWRTAESTCMTYMTTRRVFDEAKNILASYGKGAMDGTMWAGLTKRSVFRPAAIIPAIMAHILHLKRPFIFFMPLCAWKHCGLNLLRTRRFTLWQPIPTLAVHLSFTSLPLHSESLITDIPSKTRAGIQRTTLAYLDC